MSAAVLGKDCNKRGVLHLRPRWSEEKKEEILGAYHECPSMRGIFRMFGVSRQALASLLKKNEANPSLDETLLLYQENDVLELDEMWSCFLRKVDKCWAGCGLLFAAERAKLWPLFLETEVKRRVCFGSVFLSHIKNTGLSVTFGVHIARCFQNRLTAVSAKRLGRPAMPNDGTTPAVRKTLSFLKSLGNWPPLEFVLHATIFL